MIGIGEVVVVAHVQIDETVAVNVGKRSTCSPAFVADLGRARHIRKRSIPLVPIQHIRAEVGHVQIEITVVVNIADRAAHAVTRVADASVFRYIGKGAVASVPVERVLRRRIVFSPRHSTPVD